MGGWAIAVHGGAGVDPNLPTQRQEEAKQLLTRCLSIGISALRSNLPAIDVVEHVVCPHSLFFILGLVYVIKMVNLTACPEQKRNFRTANPCPSF